MYAYPIDSVVTYAEDGTPQFDRAVDSSQLRELYSSLMTNGVLLKDSSNLQVSASTNMEIVVNPGLCHIQGCIKKFSEDITITIASANATMSRIDTVVARLDLNSNYRDIGLFVIQGTPASVPTRPELTRNTSVYEIALADITIKANATSITQANISDTRLDTNRCGIISAIAEFDTTELYNQIQTDLKEFQESNELDFEQWFETMKGQLGEDAAGNLQLQIDDVNEKATEHIENTGNPHNVTAEQVSIDGYSANNVQGAIDEVSRTLGYTKSYNLLPHPYHSLTVAENGVKWTDDGEGRVTANGTTTTLDSYMQCARYSLFLPSGTYILNGCPSGGSNNTYFIVANYAENNIRYDVGYDYGEGVQFTLDEGRWLSCDVVVKQGQTVNNLVFKPMIRYASIEDDTYEPYVPSIGEIVVNESITATATATYPATIKTYSNLPKGKYIMTFRALGTSNTYLIAQIKKNGTELDAGISSINASGISVQVNISSIFEIQNSTDTIELIVQSGVALTNRAGQNVRIMRIA